MRRRLVPPVLPKLRQPVGVESSDGFHREGRQPILLDRYRHPSIAGELTSADIFSRVDRSVMSLLLLRSL